MVRHLLLLPLCFSNHTALMATRVQSHCVPSHPTHRSYESLEAAGKWIIVADFAKLLASAATVLWRTKQAEDAHKALHWCVQQAWANTHACQLPLSHHSAASVACSATVVATKLFRGASCDDPTTHSEVGMAAVRLGQWGTAVLHLDAAARMFNR